MRAQHVSKKCGNDRVPILVHLVVTVNLKRGHHTIHTRTKLICSVLVDVFKNSYSITQRTKTTWHYKNIRSGCNYSNVQEQSYMEFAAMYPLVLACYVPGSEDFRDSMIS